MKKLNSTIPCDLSVARQVPTSDRCSSQSDFRVNILHYLISCVFMMAWVPTAQAQDTTEQAVTLDEMTIVSKRDNRVSSGATGLPLDLVETPQSITVIEAETIQNFAADEINDVLKFATGVQVESWETNRTNYTSRGFEIVNTQIDGIGLPNNWGIVTGALDSYGYEKIEVIRGANGLLTGVGNSAGTLNYVRKRPTNEKQGEINVKFGEYGEKRIEADYSTPITADGRWAARVVATAQDEESYLRDLENDRSYFYGVVDGQVGDNGILTFGYSHQEANTLGNMWGALVFGYSDGSQAEWDRDSSTTLDWTYWDTVRDTAFIEYTHLLSDNWEAKLSFNHESFEGDDELFYVYTLGGLDPATDLGLIGWAYKGDSTTKNNMLDMSVSGEFELFGQAHELIAGISYGKQEQAYWSLATDSATEPAFGATPAFPYGGDAIPEPAWGERVKDSDIENKRTRIYAATNLHVTDRFTTVLGMNAIKLKRSGYNDSGTFEQTEDEVSPYIGMLYDFNENVNGYISYSDIYQNLDQYDINRVFLDAMKGINQEVGVKSEWLDKRLLVSLALFNSEQQGVAQYAGTDSEFRYYYESTDIESSGFEIEAVGEVSDQLKVGLGYTSLALSGEGDDDDINSYIPRKTINFSVTGKLTGLSDMQYGLQGKWFDDIHALDTGSGGTIEQDAYVLVDGYLTYAVAKQASLRLNVKNLGDEKYIASLMNGAGYYGAPRTTSITFSYKF